MSKSTQFSVYYDPYDYEEIWKKSPFNYKKDVKVFSDDKLVELSNEIADEIMQGIERKPITAALHWSNDRKAASAKIRTITLNQNGGKSGGYRCIVLVDYVNNVGFILHIYKHSKQVDRELKRILRAKGKGSLTHLVDEYSSSLNKG
ncbi:hypothetical protein [uncultured Ruminococcus sp.]|uniref:hypothetical protein n=1 Tax=uncultured Ruminococcus sp. TaxID=165186 RepID=UPI00293035A6|nr:hypothetical protein [uncultured Ruminococcus sp.]